MGWDIEFQLRLDAALPPARRFAQLFERLQAQPETTAFWRFEMVRRPASGPDQRITVAGEPADVALVRRHLADHGDEPDWLVQGTWTWEEAAPLGDGPRAVAGDTLTVAVPYQTYKLGARTSPDLFPPGGRPDLVIEAGDYRRYFPRAAQQPVLWHDLPPDAPAARLARFKIDALMRRVAALVDAGVVSLWGTREGNRFSPAQTYAVFHRDPERYRDDVAPPALPAIPVTDDLVKEAAARLEYAWVPSSAGPIVYTPRLGYSTLESFYWSLRHQMEFAAAERDL